MKVAYPVRLDEQLMEKMKYLAEKSSRSLNREFEYIVKNHIDSYETENSPIPLKSERA